MDVKGFALVALLVLAGCQEESHNNHGYGFHYDDADAITGVRVRYGPIGGYTLTDYVNDYTAVQECTGITAYGPLIVQVNELPTVTVDGQPVDPYGIHYPDTGLIVAYSAIDYPGLTQWIIKHEFVHYLLNRSGFDRDRNHAHDSPLFDLCAPR